MIRAVDIPTNTDGNLLIGFMHKFDGTYEVIGFAFTGTTISVVFQVELENSDITKLLFMKLIILTHTNFSWIIPKDLLNGTVYDDGIEFHTFETSIDVKELGCDGITSVTSVSRIGQVLLRIFAG